MNLQRNVKYNLMNYHLLDLWEEMRMKEKMMN